ncbi:jg13431, partial [Pararge aegeria aegeria]
MRQSLMVVSEKANKVEVLESKIKSLLERNESLEIALRSKQSQEMEKTSQTQEVPMRSFVNAVKKNQVVTQKVKAMKPAGLVIAEESLKRVNPKNISQNSNQVIEGSNNTENDSWIVINRRKSKYPNREVKKGGSTQTNEIEGTEKQKFLHVWRLRKDTTVESLEKYVRDSVKVPVKIEKIKHKTERDYSSFIIGVPERQSVTQDHRIKTTNKVIELFYQNVRGLRTKLEEFYESVASSNSDLFAITETGCNESINDAELIPPGYTIIRCDRTDGRKQGGAFLVATSRLELREVHSDVNIDAHSFEMISATVYKRERFLFLLCVVYIPPKSSENEYMVLFRIIEQFCNNYSEVIVLGDFNLYSCPPQVNNYFEYLQTYCGFTQGNSIGNCNNRCLDLVLSTVSERSGGSVSVREAVTPLVAVDAHHPPLEVAVTLCSRRLLTKSESRPTARGDEPSAFIPIGWNFHKADFKSLYTAIAAVDWTPMYELDLENSLSYFYSTINFIIHGCVPNKKRRPVTPRYVYPEWYTGEVIRDIKLKADLHRRYKASKSPHDYETFAQCRAKVKGMIALAHKQYKQWVQEQLLRDPRAFWNYTNSRRESRDPQKILKNGVLLTDEQCASEFANYFHSVYRTQSADLNVSAAVIAAGGENGAARVHLDRLTLDEVKQALKELRPKKSAGPDGIPPYIIKDCRSVLAEPLHYIFNQCLKSAV